MIKRSRAVPHPDPTPDAPAPPRAAVAHIIDQLLAGEITREAATSWADQFLSNYSDEVLDEGLELLHMTDSREGPQGPYMFGFEDLEEIRPQLDATPQKMTAGRPESPPV